MTRQTSQKRKRILAGSYLGSIHYDNGKLTWLLVTSPMCLSHSTGLPAFFQALISLHIISFTLVNSRFRHGTATILQSQKDILVLRTGAISYLAFANSTILTPYHQTYYGIMIHGIPSIHFSARLIQMLFHFCETHNGDDGHASPKPNWFVEYGSTLDNNESNNGDSD